MLEINQLTVAYDERPVLRDFSLRMKEGEITALVGESGSGKPPLSAPFWGFCRQGVP